ncbi:hypothetical protein FHETE_1964 [Fusarium heterosporum]|uniref:DUF7924 domain-containing protein n=1 Tax=Fusarium heterosporum TaxID=42747 RepID=A0A8H5TWF4_FUSHE|nr:hypothetical protein FHETE_1964 [Fusarium heterosporum]
MPPNQREIQRKLMKKYNISFDGPIDRIGDPHWPSDWNTRFEHIKGLGKYEYSQYRESITADGLRFPWRSQVHRRAKRIAEKATQCIEGRKNESGWRLSLESEIMARFSVEIACVDCRGRLWRSEQEVIVNEQAGDDRGEYNSLKARQRRRQPCNCNTNNPPQDISEQGISPLFDDRAEEAIRYSGELRSELPKREDRPDRVYGLRVTERLSRLLQLVEDTKEGIKVSPFKSDGDPLVFPFLVIEAKSEKGSDSVSDTQVQTAFAIRELLSIQLQLTQAAEQDMDRDGGPLVWFLSYKGEQWRVSAAYVHDQNGKVYYRVVRLWTGSIDSQDCALQLLLILDYIVDWARDIYREGIVKNLRKISSSDTRSLARDDDIFSLAGNLRGRTPGIADPNTYERSHYIGDPMHAFDCQEAAFRDARFIQSRFLGLIITEDNVEEFLQTGSSDEETRTLTASLLKACQYGCRVKGYMLDDLELQWTGTDRTMSGDVRPDETFIVVITTVFCVRTNWDQVRELNYLAVSESLISDLGEIGRIPSPSTQVLGRILTVESLDVFGDLLRRTARDNLTACVSELCFSTESVSTDRSNSSKIWKILPTSEDSNNVNR